MDPRLLGYYRQELLHIRDAASEFAREHPKIAGRLALEQTTSGGECVDPYVERLLVNAGLHPVIAPAELRLEAGIPVDGLVIRAEKNGIARGLQPPRSYERVDMPGNPTFGERHV